MNLLLTRPKAVAETFLAEVEARCPGKFTPIISPLLEIRPEPCSVDLTGVQAILFSSRRAVVAFTERSTERHLPALCVGDATAEDARKAGFSVQSADGDAAALAQLAAMSFIPEAGFMLHFRGAHSTGDIVMALMAEGIAAEDRIIYDQKPLSFSAEAKELLSSKKTVVAPVFSPRSASIFAHEYRAIAGRATLVAITLSQAVSESLAIPGTRVLQVARPRADLVLQALQKI